MEKMKKIKTCIITSLFMMLVFTGCGETEDSHSISEITIRNIPATFTVHGTETIVHTYKVYLNASNSMSPEDHPEAKGVIKVTPDMLDPGGTTYTVTIPLQNPNPPENKNPNLDTGRWSGTSSFFSVMISPKDTSPHEAKAIWVKGSYTLNIGKSTWFWDGSSAIDFRGPSRDRLGLVEKEQALFADIISEDPDIKK